jgi:hypothetical protein
MSDERRGDRITVWDIVAVGCMILILLGAAFL